MGERSTLVIEEPRRSSHLIDHVAREISCRKKSEGLLANMFEILKAMLSTSMWTAEQRGIDLPTGTPKAAGARYSAQPGQSDDRYFLEFLKRQGVEPYASFADLVRAPRPEDVRTASSLRAELRCRAGGREISELFDVSVDGPDLVRPGMKGKPLPTCSSWWRAGSRRSRPRRPLSKMRSLESRPTARKLSAWQSEWIAAGRRYRERLFTQLPESVAEGVRMTMPQS